MTPMDFATLEAHAKAHRKQVLTPESVLALCSVVRLAQRAVDAVDPFISAWEAKDPHSEDLETLHDLLATALEPFTGGEGEPGGDQ